MRVAHAAKRLSAKRVVPRGPPANRRRRGWTGVYGNRSYDSSYSAGCFVSSMRKHVHIGVFPNPRAAAVAHDAVLVITGSPPINCTDAEYERMLSALCAGKSVERFVHDIRYDTRNCGTRFDGKELGGGVAGAPPCTLRGELNALADIFMCQSDKPPPTEHRSARKRARVADNPPLYDPSDADTPKPTEPRASQSPPPKKQLVETWSGVPKVEPVCLKRPRSARVAERATGERVVDAEASVQAGSAAIEIVQWPSFPPDFNVVNSILFDPDLQADAHIRMWRHALTRMHFERLVNSAYAFS